jgi:hypothetical protein
MIKKTIILCLFFISQNVWSTSILTDKISIQQGKKCPENNDCMLILDNNRQTIGTLRSDPNLFKVYYFFDANHTKRYQINKVDEKLVFHSDAEDTVTKFELYDLDHALVAKITFHHRLLALGYQAFSIETPQNHTLLYSKAYLGHLGTKTGIYDNALKTEVAQIFRPLFTLDLDSEINILDEPTLTAAVDPDIFLATLALYANKALFYQNFDLKDPAYVSENTLYELREKIQKAAEYLDIDLLSKTIDDTDMQTAIQLLSDQYQNLYNDDYAWNEDNRIGREQKLQRLVSLGIDLLYSRNTLSIEQDKAILIFLKSQLPKPRHYDLDYYPPF